MRLAWEPVRASRGPVVVGVVGVVAPGLVVLLPPPTVVVVAAVVVGGVVGAVRQLPPDAVELLRAVEQPDAVEPLSALASPEAVELWLASADPEATEPLSAVAPPLVWLVVWAPAGAVRRETKPSSTAARVTSRPPVRFVFSRIFDLIALSPSLSRILGPCRQVPRRAPRAFVVAACRLGLGPRGRSREGYCLQRPKQGFRHPVRWSPERPAEKCWWGPRGMPRRAPARRSRAPRAAWWGPPGQPARPGGRRPRRSNR